MHAEQSLQEAQEISEHLQAQLKALTKQLHQARQQKASLETHYHVRPQLFIATAVTDTAGSFPTTA